MAESHDDAEPVQPSMATSFRPPTTHISSFASVNKPAAFAPPSQSAPSASPPPSAARSNGAPALHPPAESHPMTATSSSSSLPPEQQNGAPADSNGASPYGTRSRNRTGNSRPNYAEDADMDFEYTSSRKAHAAALPTTSQMNEVEKSSGSNTRRSSNTATPAPPSLTKSTPANTSRDHLPGMSSFSVNPGSPNAASAPAPSRKRKAPGAAPGPHTTPVNIQASNALTSRRAASTLIAASTRTTSLMSFDNCQGYLKNGKLKSDDGTVLNVDDQIYLVCEPPGEPYYLARIMEFLHVDNDRNLPVDSLRINWYFRPRDIQRKVNDTRVVFASMQSDTCPITSLRGKCRVLHRNDIKDLDEYRKTKDSFWYEKMFDRYIHRYYEVIPTSQVINVPAKVKKVLDERWRYVIVEIGRGKELTSAIKSCKRCGGYCASNDSVDCAVCKNTYHMNCVRPPLLKKPARGFGWSCGSCSRKQERRLEARNTAAVDRKARDGDEEEPVDEEEEDHGVVSEVPNGKATDESQNAGPRPPTAEQLAQAKLWPYRYLGIHCRVEDALDYDDRIYPRASSRLGPKHQANVQVWHGHAVQFVKPTDIKKKFLKGSGHKKDAKLTKETVAALEADKVSREKRPKWISDEPLGYIPRGEDLPNGDLRNTAQVTFRMPEVGERSSRGEDTSIQLTPDEREKFIDEYMAKAQDIAQPLFNLRPFSTNFLDQALKLLTANNYQTEKALAELKGLKRRYDLKEPELTEDEIRKFEDGVAMYGSELRNVSRHVGKSQKHGEIVRFYYMWKKTERGRRIWDNYEGRKGKKQAKQADARLLDDVADDVDDSAFDTMKATQRKRGFECKFCGSRQSPQWRRAPATAPGTTIPADSSTAKGGKDKSGHLMLALCQRCAGLWRKYGIQWENIDEVAKKVAQGGGRAWKRRIDEELLAELVSANQASSIGLSVTAAAVAASVGLEVPPSLTPQPGQEALRKKQKMAADPPISAGQQNEFIEESTKKKLPEKLPEPPLIPEQPQLRLFPCDVCSLGIRDDLTLLTCRYCRLTVHPDCFGVDQDRVNEKWLCDTCANDVNPQFLTNYECLICPQQENEDKSVMEPPKQSHKKKSEREKEKDRLEREMIAEATSLYLKQQQEKGRPLEPRQSLKPTAQRNWCHVICSVMHNPLKYATSKKFLGAEGFDMIAQSNPGAKEARCKLCKASTGFVLFCDQCEAPVHPSCAQRFGYTLGFQVMTPPKTSMVKRLAIGGENGVAEPRVYCREHGEKKHIHPLYTGVILDGIEMNAIKAYSILYKQASHSELTGTARRADLVQAATKQAAAQATGTGSTRCKLKAGDAAPPPPTRSSRVSPSAVTVQSEEIEDGDRVLRLSHDKIFTAAAKDCKRCRSDVSPIWHRVDDEVASSVQIGAGPASPMDGHLVSTGVPPRQSQITSDSTLTNRLNSSTLKEPMSTMDGTVEMSNKTRTADQEVHNSAKHQTSPSRVSTLKIEPQEEAHLLHDDSRYLCHKCYIRRKKDPTPLRDPTPKPEALQSDRSETQPAPSSLPSVWQAPAAAQPPPPELHTGYPAHPEQPAPYHGSERLPNGVAHSSPVVIPRPAPHYPPPATAIPASGPAQHYPPPLYSYRDERAPTFRPGQPMQYIPHQSNGYAQPPPDQGSFQFRRNPLTGHLIQVPYVPPALRPPSHHASPASARSPPPPRRMRSPPLHVRSPSIHEQGPHGPPEADSNPFVVPHGSHASPPQQFSGNNIYGSPRGHHERSETPTNAFDRDSRWPSEIPMPNGASASPSVRNLLH